MKNNLTRKEFITNSLLAGAGAMFLPAFTRAEKDIVMTVNGPVASAKMGFSLVHEHVMVDFIGAANVSKSRYSAKEVFEVALPFIKDAKANGVDTFIDCTPAYLGRDANILKRLANTAGINILTTTGYYGATGEKFVPKFAYTETPQQLANRWIAEWKNGIDGTGVKPGVIKTSTDKGPLTAMQRKLIQAAGLTHLATGLTIVVHSGDGAAAFEQLDILKKLGVAPEARIWAHTQSEPDMAQHMRGARLNTWLSYDNVSPDTLQANLAYLQNAKQHNLLNRVLVSQDAGWYNVGQPHGGNFKPYTCVLTQFIPLLKQHGFTQDDLHLIFKQNPAEAFAVKVKAVR